MVLNFIRFIISFFVRKKKQKRIIKKEVKENLKKELKEYEFNLIDYTRSQTASRSQVKNDPGPIQIKNLKLVHENIIIPVKRKFKNVHISSGFRSRLVDTLIRVSSEQKRKEIISLSQKGKFQFRSKVSQHIRGQAVDFEVSNIANIDLFKWCKDNLDYDQLILEFADPSGIDKSAGWVHCSYKSKDKNRGQSFYLTKENKRIVTKNFEYKNKK